MKTYILLLLACIPVFTQAQRKSADEATVTEDKTIVPVTHGIYRMINDPAHYSLEDMDSFYRNEVLKENAAPYSTNLKNMAFSLMIDKGLEEKGSDELKKYYIEEQLKADNNFTTIDKFYDLLLSCRTFMTKEELTKTGNTFFEKNKTAINTKQWPEPAQKKEKLLGLFNKHKIFNRYIVVAMND